VSLAVAIDRGVAGCGGVVHDMKVISRLSFPSQLGSFGLNWTP
jgi:hypothetical protein